MSGIDTLRVSVTDRCNLRCQYCMPAEGVAHLDHEEVLRFEELLRIVRAAVSLGVRKVRLTGGEPLVRKGFPDLVAMLAQLKGITDLPMTTNGVLLAKFAGPLKAAGLTRVTVSLDTLQPARFLRISRNDFLAQVLSGIEQALAHGLTPVKINTVIVPEQNEDEVLDFAALADKLGLEVRFIERMPIPIMTRDVHCGRAGKKFLPSREIKTRIEQRWGRLVPLDQPQNSSSPAASYRLGPGPGRIGFISAMSEPFCRTCGRMRLTADGRLRPCLVNELELDIKGPLRKGASDLDLQEIIRQAIKRKPSQDAAPFERMQRMMNQIGG